LGEPPATLCSSMPSSPYSYSYTGGSDTLVSYASGTAGLPTFGAAGTNFPDASQGFIVPVGGAGGFVDNQ
jgi:hypothetical protein